MDLEQFLRAPDGFGLDKATPVQRAFCRLLQYGDAGDLAGHPEVVLALGGAPPALEGAPAELCLLAAIRSGKSLIAAATAVWASQTCDVSRLGPGEIPRVSVLSVHRDQAQVVVDHVCGHVSSSPVMRGWMVSDPTADGVVLRHPSGRPVEIRVVAGARAGSTLVARWSAGVIFDEAPRMVGADDGVVNLSHARQAVLGRMLPGCPILYIGSPWAPFGPVYDMVTERWGHPGTDLVVVRAGGPAMNPSHWTPERCARLLRQDPDAYRTDVLAEFADPEEALFGLEMLEACTRPSDPVLAPEEGHHYAIAMDPATRTNAWTVVVLGARSGGGPAGILPSYFVARATEWKATRGNRLRPTEVLREIAGIAQDYRVSHVATDQFSADALADIARDVGLELAIHDVTAKNKHDLIKDIHTLMAERRLELPPDPVVRRDLQLVRRRVIQNGVSFVLPKTSDGRHCDYVPALALACHYAPEQPDVAEPWLDPLARRRRLAAKEEVPFYERAAERLMAPRRMRVG